ncbi:rodlet protein [Aspergillus cavernicola]|uniref:Hydrophobin n=1 Tax=Aspergillus cavernicola TaxID=176166 RepID=A0ABR4I8G6_9EURO
MKFSIAAAVMAFAATVVALPSHPDAHYTGHGAGNKGNSKVKFPVPKDVTVKQASDKCGDQAQVSCCNKATYSGDTTQIAEGLLSGVLSNLIGAGSGAEGLGLFEECSKLDLPIVGLQDFINQKCKQNIACCQNSPSSANGDLIGVALPCLSLGAIL